jgi:thiamine pyrophosphokinase
MSGKNGLVVEEESVIEDGVKYKFYKIPIESTLRLVLSNETVMEQLFEFHKSMVLFIYLFILNFQSSFL